ncbi:MAG TPA: PBP1A family penicillin-binding protein [Pyrinomonadaceae bacterium]|nr:PBP1A family penicillin-binding protein [Pyrinomonadaceae bacterium]
MAIEITSVYDGRSLRQKLARVLRVAFRPFIRGKRRFLFRSALLLVLIALAAVTVTLLQSYRFYSRIIDARLASGYLTSRPGIYAAPRSLSLGQKVSRLNLIAALRRAGYAESSASDVWSGSFSAEGNVISIRPNRTPTLDPMVIRVIIDGKDRVSSLTGDEVTLENFTLEAEVLTNDPTAKNGERTQLTYHELPPVLVHAILSIEDRRFFEHRGLDPLGVLRALMRNAGDDHIGQGGSTITQQLVKNTYLSAERTYQRKFAEAMLAFALERRLSKEDIFALYCNEVYLGQRGAVTVRGVEQAARTWFAKDVKDLTLAEAATIAGMIQGPTRYAPERHPEVSQSRRNIVLGTMVRDGWLTVDQAAAAAKEPVAVAPLGDKTRALAPWFIDYVNRVAESESPSGEDHGRIYTTVDLDLQRLAEDALQRQFTRLDQVYKNREAKPQAALVALDPRTGNVLAMVGGRDYAQSQLNRATDARRQPGSTFKPFVYAAALEGGMSPGQIFADAPRAFHYDRNRVYRPVNFGGGFSMRDVTMRTGLVKSLNVVTVDVAMQTGLAHIANLAEQFGLPKPERYPALALGTTEVTPLQLAAAYGAFVNGGTRVTPRVMAKVGSPEGSNSTSGSGPGAQVIKPTTAFMITNMLAAVIDHGTARAARGAVKGTAIAGKTGTSRDGWFVGYTPNLVCAVWIGFDDNQQLGLTGAEAALPAWAEFMKGAVELRPALGGRNFLCPEGIRFVETDADNGLLSTLSCPNRELIAITDALAPNVECYAHGNLPNSQAEQPQANVAGSVRKAPPNRRSNRDAPEPLITAGTRVDIDQRGRRTLVNAMR